MTRMRDPDPEVDQALVDLARSDQITILELERLVRSFNLYAEQEQPPSEDPSSIRDVKDQVEGDPNHELLFYRPGGSYIGSTYPAAAPGPSGRPRRLIRLWSRPGAPG